MSAHDEARRDADLHGLGFMVDGQRVHPSRVIVVRALLAAAPAPAMPATSVDTKDFERLANKWFSSRFISTEELGKAWAEMVAHIDADKARAVAAKDEEILALHRKLAGETLRANQGWQRYEEANRDRNALRASAPQQHAQAALSDEQIHAIINAMPQSAFEPTVAIGEITVLFDNDAGEDEEVFESIKAYAKIVAYRAILAASHQPAAAPAQPVADLIVHMNSVEAKIRPEYSTFDALKVGTYPVYLAAQAEVKP